MDEEDGGDSVDDDDTSIHTCIHPFIHTYINAFIHPYIHPSIRTSIHPSIHTYIHHLSPSQDAAAGGSGDYDEVDSKAQFDKWSAARKDARRAPILDALPEEKWMGGVRLLAWIYLIYVSIYFCIYIFIHYYIYLSMHPSICRQSRHVCEERPELDNECLQEERSEG